MLIIEPKLYLGEGNQRTVYSHPDDPTLCIKIIKPNSEVAVKRQLREVRYYKLLKRKKISFENISRYLGELTTDQGVGYLYEKVLDFDGQLSEGLEQSLRDLGPESEASAKLIAKVQQLGMFIKKNKIIFHDYLIRDNKNVLCRKEQDGSYTPIIVDALGDTAFIDIMSWSKKQTDKRIIRKWNKFLVDPMVKLLPWVRREDLEI